MYAEAINNYIHAGMDKEDYKTVEEWQPFGDPSLVIAEESQPPAKPSTPNGPTDGEIGIEYTYTTTTTDPDSDEIYYLFDWGDGTNSGWVGPFNNTTASVNKTWSARATYKIRVVAKDIHGQLSVLSDPLSVTLLRNRVSRNTLFSRFLEQFPLDGITVTNGDPAAALNSATLTWPDGTNPTAVVLSIEDSASN